MYLQPKMSHTNYHQSQPHQQHNFQFSQNYQNMPQSALPHASHYSMNQPHQNIQYRSVPSSPMSHQAQSQQPVFQFNPSLVAHQLTQKALKLNEDNFYSADQSNSIYSTANNSANNFVSSLSTNNIQKKIPGELDEAGKIDPFMLSKQYSENDVEMVQEILNDMIQKEENPVSDIIPKDDELNLASFEQTLMSSPHGIKQESNDNNNGGKIPSVESSFSPGSTSLNDSVSSAVLSTATEANKQGINDPNRLLSSLSLENLTHAANIILSKDLIDGSGDTEHGLSGVLNESSQIW